MEGERGNSKRLLGGAQSLGNRTKLGEDELLGTWRDSTIG